MSPILRILIGGACLVIILAGIKAASEIISFVLIAALLAISITPIVIFLTSKGLKRGPSLFITIFSLLVTGLMLLTLLGTSVFELSRTLPTYEERMQQILVSVDSILEKYNFDIDKVIEQTEFDTKKFVQLATTLLGKRGNFFGSVLFLIIIVSLVLGEFSCY